MRRGHEPRPRRSRDDSGISLIEVIIAFSILLLVTIPLGYTFDSAAASGSQVRQHETALELADEWTEILSNTSSTNFPPVDPTTGQLATSGQQLTPTDQVGTVSNNPTINGTTYTVKVAYTLQAISDDSDLCTAGNAPSINNPVVLDMQVTVYWNNQQSLVTDTTAIDYPQPGVQTDGFIAVQLANDQTDDQAGNSWQTRISNIPITVAKTDGSYTVTLQANSLGCAFATVPTGYYNVSLGQPTGKLLSNLSPWNGSPAFGDNSGSFNETPVSNNNQIQVSGQTTVSLTYDEGVLVKNITYGSSTQVSNGVFCPGTSTVQCVAAGTGASGATVEWESSGSWSGASLSSIQRIQSVACTTGSSTICAAGGYATSGTSTVGEIMTTGVGTDFSTRHFEATAGVSDISQVACPTANGCYALGTSTSGSPVILAGDVTGAGSDTWKVVSTSSLIGVTSIACPDSGTAATIVCELGATYTQGPPIPVVGVLRLEGDPATIGTTSTWQPTVLADTMPTGLTTIGQIACPSTSACVAFGTGDAFSSTDQQILSAPISGAAGTASTWSDDLPATSSTAGGAGTLGSLSCTSTTCVAVETPSASPITSTPAPTTQHVWTGVLAPVTTTNQANGVADSATWTSQPISALASPSPYAVTGVTCGAPTSSETAQCLFATSNGLTTPSTNSLLPAAGSLIDGSDTHGFWTYNAIAAATAASPTYFGGVACDPLNGTRCAAVGGATSGAFYLGTTSGPNGTWTSGSPNVIGTAVNNIPVEVAQSGTTTWTTQYAYGAGSGGVDEVSFPNPIYPSTNGYFVSAGDACTSTPGLPPSATVNVAPGSTASPTIPLSQLSVEVLTATGALAPGASVTITPTVSGCATGSETFTLPSTGADGTTVASVPFGTYSLKATSGATVSENITISGNSVTTVASSSTTYLPQALVVVL